MHVTYYVHLFSIVPITSTSLIDRSCNNTCDDTKKLYDTCKLWPLETIHMWFWLCMFMSQGVFRVSKTRGHIERKCFSASKVQTLRIKLNHIADKK